MSDLIDRQAAIDLIMSEPTDVHYPSWFAEILKKMPSAERKKGKWIEDKCSACGYRVEPWNNTPYCPNCGADMRGEQE